MLSLLPVGEREVSMKQHPLWFLGSIQSLRTHTFALEISAFVVSRARDLESVRAIPRSSRPQPRNTSIPTMSAVVAVLFVVDFIAWIILLGGTSAWQVRAGGLVEGQMFVEGRKLHHPTFCSTHTFGGITLLVWKLNE
jgi:hypothetical protein